MAMPELTPSQQADAQRRFLLILWGAMGWTVVMYFGVAQVTQPRDVRPQDSLTSNILLAVALILVAASFAVKSRFLAQTADPARKRAGFILALAMCEAAATLGIVVKFAFGTPQYYWLMLVGLAGILLHYPRREY
jgi:hypothetical protein